MDILFDKDYLKELYVTGKTSDKKHRYQPQIISKYVRVIDMMMSLPDTLSLMRINSLNYEKLRGDKKGLSSVRVNDQYRIEFENKKDMITSIKGIDPNMIANNLEPFRPTHPGEVLKDELEYRKISQKQLANEMGISYTLLNEVLNGKRQVNTEFALLVEAALDIPAESLLQMQARYNMLTAKRNKSFMEKLQNVRKIVAAL